MPGKTLQPNPRVYIMAVADAKDDDGEVIGDGKGVSGALRDALVAHQIAPFVGDVTRVEDALAAASKLGYPYVLKAELVAWEDNATEWSGNADRAGISVELYETGTNSMVASSSYRMSGSSSGWVYASPNRFAAELADVSLSKIFSWAPEPWDSPGYRNKKLR